MNRRIHSIPIGDLEIHCAQATCWCHPFELEPGIFAHNAKDCREAAERQTGQGCSEGWINIAESHPTIETARRHFEAFVSTSPFERDITRWPEDPTKHAWPGQYRDLTVELAWQAYLEALYPKP